MRRLGLLVVTATALVIGACGDNIVPETPIDSPRADARPDGTGPDGMIDAMRAERRSILARTRKLGNLGVAQAPMNSPDHDCAAQVVFTLPSRQAAKAFSSLFPSVIAGETGRHNYTEWDQVLMGAGAAHPAMNPYNMAANADCRKAYSKDMCARSLEILNRTVMVGTSPLHTVEDIANIVHNIDAAAQVALAGLVPEDGTFRAGRPIETQKFDLATA